MKKLLSCLAVAGLALCEAPGAPIRVLLLTGSNNHDWRATTPVLQQALEKTGRFQVTLETNVPAMTPASFAAYDVLLSNFNTFGPKGAAPDWSAETKAAFLAFVRGGKGFVTVHAGSSSYYDWPEYHQIAGATWKNNVTHHNAPHSFTVTATAADHPVTRGQAPFSTTDELWLNPGVQTDATVLATGDGQPVALATASGQGRGFALMLGHSAAFMSNTGFQTLLVRGTEWAATGQATLTAADMALQAVAAYQYGQSRAPLLEAAREAQRAPREWAPALAGLLDGEATVDAKKFACDQLALIGTDAEVPFLARRIGDTNLDFAARAALERIPGEAAGAALRDALPAAAGEMRTGLVLALGTRGDAKAVPAIAKLLPDAAAIDALGLIGDRTALAALAAAEAAIPPEQRVRWAAALLRAAIRVDDGATLEKLCATAYPEPVRVAAFIRRAAASGELAAAALAGDDTVLRQAALSVLQTSTDRALFAQIAGRVKTLPPPMQVQLLTLLAERGDSSALAAATDALGSPDADVRKAAVQALGALGDRTAVPVALSLLERTTDEAERKAIGDSLARMKGEGVDATLIAAAGTAAPAVRAEVIRALVVRDAASAAPAFLAAASTADADVRQEAIRGLKQLGDASVGPGVIALLDGAADADRPSIEVALAAIFRRAQTVGPLVDALGAAAGPKKVSLLAALGAVGGPQALAALRGQLKAGDVDVQTAAVRALSNWPDAAPLEDLVAAAEATQDVKLKAMALRGVAQLAPKDGARPAKELAALLQRAIAASGREEETALLKGVRATIAGGNLARGATATNLDGLAPDFAGGGPAAAIDGNPDTYWDETDNQNLYWLKVTLKRPATVAALKILGFTHQNYAPKDFEVLCDGKAVKTVTNLAYAENVAAVELPPTTCSTVELKITGRYGPSPAIRELEIYGEEAGP